MVEPSIAPDVPFAVPGELIERIETAERDVMDALLAAARDRVSAEPRQAVAAAERELAEACDELADIFTGCGLVRSALLYEADRWRKKAAETDRLAVAMQARAAGGDG